MNGKKRIVWIVLASWDEDSRRIEFGDSSAPVVRLTTVNGPVSIRSDRPEED
jgi:hypothetical protein